MNNLVAKIIEHMEEVNISNDQGCTPLQVSDHFPKTTHHHKMEKKMTQITALCKART